MGDIHTLFQAEGCQAIADYVACAKQGPQVERSYERMLAYGREGAQFPVRIILGCMRQLDRTFIILIIRDDAPFLEFINSVKDAYFCFNRAGKLLAKNIYADVMLALHMFDGHLTFSDLELTSANDLEGNQRKTLPTDLQILADNQHVLQESYVQIRSFSGDLIPVAVSMWPENQDGEDIFNLIFRDQTATIQNEKQLRYTAYHDVLTRLPNRIHFTEVLGDLIRNHEACEHKFALMFIDLDKFKFVNDSLGHAAGDQLLVEATERMQRSLRKHDFIARLGGDEFTAILPEIETKQVALDVAERICESIKSAFIIDGETVHVSASIGVAYYPDDAKTLDDLIKSADLAMYEVKVKGRNGVRVYSPDLKSKFG
jgi:diguanylate cyclase (GGDEF)-like protein